MFKILMLSKITIILTTSVNNTNNAHANDLANNFFFFFEKAIYTAVRPTGRDTQSAFWKITVLLSFRTASL